MNRIVDIHRQHGIELIDEVRVRPDVNEHVA